MLSIARKLALAGATGGTTYLLSSIAHAPLVWTLTLAVFLGGVVLVVQFLLDFETAQTAALTAQQANVEILRRSVVESLALVEGAHRLLTTVDQSALDRTPEDVRPVTELVRALATFEPSAPLLNQVAIEEVRALTSLLHGLREGSASYPGEDRDWLLALTRSTTKRISATSTAAVDGGERSFADGFWRTELARSYLQAQREAVQRGVEVRRVFILSRANSLNNSDFLATCEEQRDAGIIVKTIVVPSVGDSTWTTTFRDFILFDDAVSYEPELSRAPRSQPSIVNTHLRVDQVRVDERQALFEEIWMAAREEPRHPDDGS